MIHLNEIARGGLSKQVVKMVDTQLDTQIKQIKSLHPDMINLSRSITWWEGLQHNGCVYPHGLPRARHLTSSDDHNNIFLLQMLLRLHRPERGKENGTIFLPFLTMFSHTIANSVWTLHRLRIMTSLLLTSGYIVVNNETQRVSMGFLSLQRLTSPGPKAWH